jgi:hypothetical protein
MQVNGQLRPLSDSLDRKQSVCQNFKYDGEGQNPKISITNLTLNI